MANFTSENRFDFRKMEQEDLFEHFRSGFAWGRRHEKHPYQYWDQDIKTTNSLVIGQNAVDNQHNLAVRSFASPVSDSSYKIGILCTDKYVKKGCKVSASIKLPAETGVWPGFWLTAHPDDDKGWPREIDIFEGYNREGLFKPYDKNRIFGHTLQSNGHYGSLNDPKETGAKTHRVKKDVTKNYINYELSWENEIIIIYNDRKVRRIKDKAFLKFIAGAKMKVVFSLFLMPGQTIYPPVSQMLVNELVIIQH
jgi:beta-glucanase (GH16 family)